MSSRSMDNYFASHLDPDTSASGSLRVAFQSSILLVCKKNVVSSFVVHPSHC